MTIASTARKAGPLLGTGTQTAFPFTFKVFAAGDLLVTRANALGTETALVLDVDYTVTLNSNQETSPGGTVTYPIRGAALPADSVLAIVGDLDYDQPLDLPSGGNFSPLALENQLDRATMQIQQLNERLDRTFSLPVSSSADSAVPAPTAGYVIGWDALGERLTNLPAAVGTSLIDLAAPGGSALVGFRQAGDGAVARTVEGKLREVVSRSDYDTLANAWASAGFKPLIDPTTGKMFLTVDSSPLNYSTSRAGFVLQQRDTANGATNELIPGAVFQFNYTGNGTVNSGIELSQTIWQGLFGFARKTGDGSGHNFTAIGELGATGPGGYNELGMFQGEATNTGSALGTMSGIEMLLKDSPDGGTTTFSTKMQAVVGRIAKYNPTVRKSFNFFASSEGTLAPNAILGGNTAGLAKWERGFDFQGLTFSSGQFGLAPNNTFLAWLRANGSASSVLGVNDADGVFLAATHAAGVVNITDSAFATRIQVDNNATNAVLIWVGGVLKRVTEGAADSAGVGFKQLRVAN